MNCAWKEKRLSDEGIAKAQSEFEKRLTENVDLPDGIRRREGFVYWNLMRLWFGKLDASSRYDESKASKLRSDWLDYMDLLEHSNTLSFLASEASDESKQQDYWRELERERDKLKIIENAFAAAIGMDAIQQLEGVRNSSYNAFDQTGKKPIAPAGYHYSAVSINPYVEELCKDITNEEKHRVKALMEEDGKRIERPKLQEKVAGLKARDY